MYINTKINDVILKSWEILLKSKNLTKVSGDTIIDDDNYK